jgi:hypothetical protein
MRSKGDATGLTPTVPDPQFIFINAWNEWSEGCYLEPDAQYGRLSLSHSLNDFFNKRI